MTLFVYAPVRELILDLFAFARGQGCSRTSLSYMADSILTSINLAGGSFNVFYDTILAQGTAGRHNSTSSYNFSIPSGWKCLLITFANYQNSDILTDPVAVFVSNIDVYGKFISITNGNYSIGQIGSISNLTFNIRVYVSLSYIVIA